MINNFLSLKFLNFILVIFIGFLIFNIIFYFILKNIIKSKYIEDIKFDFLGNWIDIYCNKKFTKKGE